jgi:hypothetical protein
MAEYSKYPFEDLKQEDKDILDKCVLNYLMAYYSVTVKYPDPKQYANKEASKVMNSDKEILKMSSLLFIQNNPAADKPIKPEDLKKTISDRLTNPLNEISEEITIQMSNVSKSLTPTSLREKVLEKLEEEGILENYQGKEHYKKSFPGHPGRKSSNEMYEDRGGKRSIYFVNKDVLQLKEVLKKPTAIEYLNHKLINSGYLQKIVKYIIKAFLYLVKSNNSNSLQAFNYSFEILNHKLSKKDVDELPSFVNALENLTDEQIEIMSEKASEGMMKEKEMFSKIVPLFGYVHL